MYPTIYDTNVPMANIIISFSSSKWITRNKSYTQTMIITGTAIIKEKSAAALRVHPINMPPAMVAPEREFQKAIKCPSIIPKMRAIIYCSMISPTFINAVITHGNI